MLFNELKELFTEKTNFKDLYTKSTNSSQDRYIRFYIKCISSLETSRWIVLSNIL